MLRWFLDATRVAQLAVDSQISGPRQPDGLPVPDVPPTAALVPIAEDFEVCRQAAIELGWAATHV